MSLRYENDTVICHHLKDEYSINADDIKSVELGENVKELKLVRNFGFGTITIQKGDFTVDGKGGYTVFLWMETGNYIKFVTDNDVYYINGASEAETAEVYKNIKR